MNETTIREGDRVGVVDWSYCFGIRDGKYSGGCGHKDEYIVIRTDLRVIRNCDAQSSGSFTQVCDILITDKGGDEFWFTQTRFVRPIQHTITIDGEDVCISDKSFNALKKQFLG